MSSPLTQYSQVHPFRSRTVKSTPDAVPPTEELEALQADLKELRRHTLERAKKADGDLRTIEDSMRRLKEKEKGKAKEVEKTRRECASLL
jgi:transcriptional adapter 3